MFYPRLRKAVEVIDLEDIKSIFEENKEALKECTNNELAIIPLTINLDILKLYHEYIPNKLLPNINNVLDSTTTIYDEDLIRKLIDVGYVFNIYNFSLFYKMTPKARELVLDHMVKTEDHEKSGFDIIKGLIKINDLGSAKYLIEKHNFNITYQNVQKKIFRFSSWDEPKIIKKLIDLGADMTAKNSEGNNIFDMLACCNKNKLKELLELLELDALRSEVEELREKTSELDSLRHEVVELRKLKEKLAEKSKELVAMRSENTKLKEKLIEKAGELNASCSKISLLVEKLAEKTEPTPEPPSEPTPDQSQEFDYMFYDDGTWSLWAKKCLMTHPANNLNLIHVKDVGVHYDSKYCIVIVKILGSINIELYSCDESPKMKQFYNDFKEFFSRTEPISN